MLTTAQLAAQKGIDLNAAVRNYKRRLRYAQCHAPRTEYYWPETATLTPYVKRYGNADQISRDLAALRAASHYEDTDRYVRIWCHLNHLKG
jgi:hypothetical protein